MRYRYTISYVVFIVLVNLLFQWVPTTPLWGQDFSVAEFMVGAVYVLRDLAQREIKHRVLLAMLMGAGISYLLADKQVAIASLAAFSLGELIDWLIYTYTRKPLSQRLLWSALVSVPIDSAVFLQLIHLLNWLSLAVLTVAKMLGVVALWYYWRVRSRRAALTDNGIAVSASSA